MGKFYELHCEDCGCKNELMRGSGMMTWIEAEELKSFLKDGRAEKKIQALYNAMCSGSGEEDTYLNIFKEYEVFFCEECKQLFNERRTVISSNLFEVKEQSVKCPTCGEDGVLLQNMVLRNEDIFTKENMMCPRCNGNMKIKWLGMWD